MGSSRNLPSAHIHWRLFGSTSFIGSSSEEFRDCMHHAYLPSRNPYIIIYPNIFLRILLQHLALAHLFPVGFNQTVLRFPWALILTDDFCRCHFFRFFSFWVYRCLFALTTQMNIVTRARLYQREKLIFRTFFFYIQ